MDRIKTIGTRAALTAALAFTFGTGAAMAQDSANPNRPMDSASTTDQPLPHNPRGGNMSSMSDAKFAKEAAQGGMAEVKMGELAQQKGTSDSVKNFGKQMVGDHSKAGDDLKAAATRSNIDLPMNMTPKDQAIYDKLSNLSGRAFDQAYASDMVRDHMHDVAAFRQESTEGKDDNIKSFASETLPTLESHLKAAHAMANDVGAPQTSNSSNPTGARKDAVGSSSNPGSTAQPAVPQQ